MKLTAVFFLPLLLCISLFSNAQNYELRYETCSAELRNWKTFDEHYLLLLEKRDSCLQGAVAPDFKATTIDGHSLQLSLMKGKVVVLNFWYTHCKPCIEEMPALNQLVEHYANQDVVFISFAPEDETELRTFFKTHPFLFTHVSKDEVVGQKNFKLSSARPYALIIDKEGKISRMWPGADPANTYATYDEVLKQLLK